MPGNIVNITPEDIASWPEPNYVNPEVRAWMPEYAGVLYGVSSIMILLRIWLRATKQAGGLGLDDAMLCFAWLASSMFTTVTIMGASVYHADRHAWDVPLENFVGIAEMAWLGELAFLVTGGATKISVLLFYRRLAAGTYSRRWRWLVIAAILFTAAWSIAFVLTLAFNCSPTEAYWRSFDPTFTTSYTCVDTTIVNLLSGIFAILSDLYSVALPCIMARNFELPKRQRVALDIIFSLGLLVVAASGVRTYYLYEVGHISDVTTPIFNVYIWAQLELQLGIMCASLPALRVFFRNYLSVSLSRITNSVFSTHTGTAAHEESKLGSVIDPESIRVVSHDHKRIRDDFSARGRVDQTLASKGSETFSHVAEADPWSPVTSPPRDVGVVSSPEDYEMYNLKSMEKYRQSVRSPPRIARSGSRGAGANFSLPSAQQNSLYTHYRA